MSSDGYFEDDLDEEFLNRLNEIEAQVQQPVAKKRAPSPILIESSDYEDTFDLDQDALDTLDEIERNNFQQPRQFAPPSKTLQTTLTGEILPRDASTSKGVQRTKGRPRVPPEPRKTKQWDHTAFAKTGVKKPKGKEKQRDDDDMDEEEEEEFEFEQFPAPFVSRAWVSQGSLLGIQKSHTRITFFSSPPLPMKIQPDLLEAKHWIFPLNRPKRDYQFDIVKNSLFENTIVALPTGLGKTFIAGVVMLNYYRWFPEGKVVFVAPTKPLVAQQIEACHEACGIPGTDAVELTGQIPKTTRNKFWAQKRVFYMTPQTLINDLQSENCDVQDIVLLVVDEAHRASGNYAYNQVIRFMMAKNPHFRVLALTATPGSNVEAVQTLIDGLHISRIEIRDERELARYNHEKKIEQHIIQMSPEVIQIRDLLVKFMDQSFKSVANIWRGQPNFIRMHPYAPQARMGTLEKNQRHLCGALQVLSTFARFMGYLMEGSLKICYDELEMFARNRDDEREGMKPSEKAAETRKKKIHTNPVFLSIMAEIRAQNAQGFSIHPKMEKMKTLIVQHFGARMSEDGDPEEGNGATKAMVFVTHRAMVDEIVDVLNQEKPLIRATPFIGQGTDKKGKKGLAQREQLEVIKKFKNNEFNVLVATSIGEEGLDIGEVDLAICYDAQKTPIRMLQRLGRTGRKRSGHVHVLLADGREEMNFDKAQSTYEDVQSSIIHGSHLEYYADVERLLPDNVEPQCLEKEMEILPYVREEGRKKRLKGDDAPTRGVKRKRNDDFGRNIPQGASTGFVSVADLVVKGKGEKKAKKIRLPKNFEALGEDDEDDLEIAAGVMAGPSLLRKSKSSSDPKPKTNASALRKSRTLDPSKPKKTKKGKGKEKGEQGWTASQFQAKGMDDSDDKEIENGVLPKARQYISPVASPTSLTPSPRKASSERAVVDGDAGYLSLTDSEVENFEQAFESPPKSWNYSPKRSPQNNFEPFRSPSKALFSPSPRKESSPQIDGDLSHLISDHEDEDFLDFEISHSSPLMSTTRKTLEPDNSIIELEDDSDAVPHARGSSPELIEIDDSVELVEHEISPPPPSQIRHGSWFPTSLKSRTRRSDMPPPALPARFLESPEAPEPTFAPKPVGKRRLATVPHPDSSPLSEGLAPARRRLHRRQESSESNIAAAGSSKQPSKEKDKHKKRLLIPAKHNPLFDYNAEHSGDKVSEGTSGSEEESESDRMFLEELPETQMSPSYDQTIAYRQSLLTQVPGGAGPRFANNPIRRAPFGRNSTRGNRREGVSSSPRMNDDESDAYEFGSFVVDDDMDILYET